jgi:UDP-N-acetylmuramoyl-tripeptide--D-alanyl-D-alanine ligase
MQMIDTLVRIPAYTRRVLVAGEMLELGESSRALHYECGAWAARHGVNLLVGVGPTAGETARGAVEAGLAPDQVKFFAEVERATEFVDRALQVGDLALIKGSRGVHLERMVQALRSRHAEQKS